MPTKSPFKNHIIWSEEDNLELVRLYREGRTHSDLGRHFGVSRTSITKHIELIRYKYNLEKRKKRESINDRENNIDINSWLYKKWIKH